MDTELCGRRVAVVVTGGIAAYKTAFVVRDLVAAGANVVVSMTPNATHFIGPATFEAITKQPVLLDLFEGVSRGNVEHVSVARSIEVVLVAPATANVLAKMACGIADDAATTFLLATEAVIFVAPAMNDGMWRNQATQANLETLRSRGIRIVEPEVGFLAEGYEGVGRMAEPERLLEAIKGELFSNEGD